LTALSPRPPLARKRIDIPQPQTIVSYKRLKYNATIA